MTTPFTPASVKPPVTVAQFAALDLRVGTIEAVEVVSGSKRLVKLTVNLGDHTRTILAGMRQERGNVQQIVGLQALFLVNMEPRKMAGEISYGMLVDVGYVDGVTPSLLVTERPMPDGARAG
jgi:tRNA-binding protein